MSVNKVILIGNVGKEPDLKVTKEGFKIVTFSVATSEFWKDKLSGERREKTQWHRIVVFNDHLCDIAIKHLQKGSKVYIEGEIQYREWEENGQKKNISEIVLSRFKGEISLLDSRKKEETEEIQQPTVNKNFQYPLNDEVPF